MGAILNRFKINNHFSGILAIFCSDERFVEINLKFLRNSLKIKQFDLITIPGGPAFLVNNELNLLERLRILVEAHGIKQIILISHYDCGYYKKSIGDSSEEKILNKQMSDIRESLHIIKKIFKDISVKGFYVQTYNSEMIEHIQIQADET